MALLPTTVLQQQLQGPIGRYKAEVVGHLTSSGAFVAACASLPD